jgi:hypothetical protein
MQLWLDLIPAVGALLTLTANLINLTIALTARRNSNQVRKQTASHAPTFEPHSSPTHRNPSLPQRQDICASMTEHRVIGLQPCMANRLADCWMSNAALTPGTPYRWPIWHCSLLGPGISGGRPDLPSRSALVHDSLVRCLPVLGQRHVA